MYSYNLFGLILHKYSIIILRDPVIVKYVGESLAAYGATKRGSNGPQSCAYLRNYIKIRVQRFVFFLASVRSSVCTRCSEQLSIKRSVQRTMLKMKRREKRAARCRHDEQKLSSFQVQRTLFLFLLNWSATRPSRSVFSNPSTDALRNDSMFVIKNEHVSIPRVSYLLLEQNIIARSSRRASMFTRVARRLPKKLETVE